MTCLLIKLEKLIFQSELVPLACFPTQGKPAQARQYRFAT